jgi:hypothetical protein
MSALRSTDAFETAGPADAPVESLAERMARSPLPLVETLRYAADIAMALRDLHRQGLAYGAVSAQLIELGPSGAALRTTGGLRHLGDARRDVAAYGAVLEAMLRPAETADAGWDALRAEARALALACRNESPGMRHVLIALRLLGLWARQSEAVVRPSPRPTLVRSIPSAAAAVPVERPRSRRRFSQAAARACLPALRQFAEHFHRPPDQPGPDRIRPFQSFLLRCRRQGYLAVEGLRSRRQAT